MAHNYSFTECIFSKYFLFCQHFSVNFFYKKTVFFKNTAFLLNFYKFLKQIFTVKIVYFHRLADVRQCCGRFRFGNCAALFQNF